MATHRPHERQHDRPHDAEKPRWEPPRGIWYEERPKCTENPCWLFWRENGVKKWAKYEDARTRETAAKALAEKRKRHGTGINLAVDMAKWQRWLEFEKIVGEGVDPLIVAVEWKAMRQGRASSTVGMWTKEAVDTYTKAREADRTWGSDSKRHAKTHLKRFVDRFAQKRLNEIEVPELRDWIFGLKDSDGEPLSLLTIKDHRKNICAFFEWAKIEGLITNNPFDAIKAPKIEEKDVWVAPVRAVFDFFKANRDAACIGRIAMEAFGGVRYSTAGKIDREGINFDQRGIRMVGRVHKGGKTKYRQGQPDNCWAWIKHAPDACWKLTLLEYREAKRNAAIRSGLRPAENTTDADDKRIREIKNVWRHSFASYHLAAYKDVPKTQYLMQHSDQDTTEIYEGVADENDARLFFAITPESVLLTWEEFVRQNTQTEQPQAGSAAAA